MYANASVIVAPRIVRASTKMMARSMIDALVYFVVLLMVDMVAMFSLLAERIMQAALGYALCVGKIAGGMTP